jgi:hypothetical protein
MHLKRILKKAVKILLTSLILALIIATCYYGYSFTGNENALLKSNKEAGNKEIEKLQVMAAQAKIFCHNKGYNHKICFLVDMKLPSGKNRFFIYDLIRDSIINAGIVAHGSCNQRFLSEPKFSNQPGCGCTALGKYKIGDKYKGRFGTAYKLLGLDSSNNNAFKRNIVLHSYYLVPDKETYPLPVCNSLGCAMVSYNYLCALARNIDASDRPILLWIFE